jgi:excisionase family DNA binding protein
MSLTSSLPTRKYIRAQELATMLAVHRTTLWRWVHDGHLPRPVRLGPNTVAWDSTQIDAWLASRAGAEEGGSACNGDNVDC